MTDQSVSYLHRKLAMPPKPDVSEKRTAQILEAAREVFARKGFHKARMEDIAARANLSKGTLYLYFKNKDALITALLDRLFQSEMSDLRAIQQEDAPAAERLWRFMETITADVQGSWMGILPVVYEFLALIFRNPLVQKAFRQYLRTYIALSIPIIEDGIARGEFRPVDPQEAALALGALFEGTLLLWVYDPETVDVERHIRSGFQILLEGMRA